MRILITHILVGSLIFSTSFAPQAFAIPLGGKNSDKKSQSQQTKDTKNGEDQKNRWTYGRASEEGPSEEDRLSLEIPGKAKFLVQRSLILAIHDVVAERYQSTINEHYQKLYQNYGGYIRNASDIQDFSLHFQDQISQQIFKDSYQEILNRAHSKATANLAVWSKKAQETGSEVFKKEYALYDMIQPGIEAAFRRMADPKNGKGVASAVLATIHTIITDHISRSASLGSPSHRVEPKDLKDLLKTVGDNSDSLSGESGALVPVGKLRRSETIPGSKSNVLIDIADGETRVSPLVMNATVEIPDVDFKKVMEQNPETLKYKLRKPVAGATHFATQSVLFNIPLFFVTVALVGLDSAKNPQAIDQFAASLKDPAVHLGFALFMLTNHKVAVGFSKVVKNPQLRFMAAPLGMAAGMLAQSVFSDLWNDQDIRGCARSMYAPSAENADSCNNAWNEWVLTNKISQYTPAVMGLLSTALAAGLVQKFGGMAVSGAAKAVKLAEAELSVALKDAMNEDPVILKAKQKLANAKANLNIVTEYTAQFREKLGQGFASASGRLGVRVKGLWAISKDSFRNSIDLEAYLLRMKKLKGIVNFSLVTLGTNLVFLALDPFISEPLHQSLGKSDLTSFNLKQALESQTIYENYSEMISTYFSHKMALPHEKDFKTIPQILEAYTVSLDANIANNFKGYDLLACYASAPMEQKGSDEKVSAKLEDTSFLNSSLLPDFLKEALAKTREKGRSVVQWSVDSHHAVGRYLLNQGLYAANPDCVVKSDFKTWLNKYSEAEKAWRTLALSQVIASSNAWSETIANFITNYETTDKFYQHLFLMINAYQYEKTHGGNPVLPSEELVRSALVEKVKEISQVPLRAEWGEDTKARFEKLFPDTVESFETPEYADYLIASMACGPDPKASVSFMQNLRSLSWLPWESLSRMAPSVFSTWQTVAPNSSIIETYPGTSFKYIAPRVTPVSPSDICGENKKLTLTPNRDGFGPESPMGLYQRPIMANGVRYKNLIHYIFETASADIVNPSDVIDNFSDWNKKVSTVPIFDEHQGVWPVVKQNYENLMKHHFLPVLNDSTMEEGCAVGGSVHCALTEDVYLRANGVIYSGVNEIYTYIRALRKIARHLSESGDSAFTLSKQWTQEGSPVIEASAFSTTEQQETLKKYMSQNFEKQARAVAFTLLDKATAWQDPFDHSYVLEKVVQLKESYMSSLPQSNDGIAAMDMANQIFEKLSGVVGEIQGYKQFSQLTFEKGAEPKGLPVPDSMANPYDPRNKGAQPHK